MKKIIAILCFISIALFSFAQNNWYQAGFKISTSFPLNRTYADRGDYLEGLGTADFGVFFRAGKYVYGEVGLGYCFFKGTYKLETGTDLDFADELVETRYLQIPVKVVGNVPMGRSCAFLPYAGIIYQPLIQVTDNTIGYSKNNIERNLTLLTAGFDFKLGFIVLGVNYRYGFQHFFQNQTCEHPQYINICAGFQF
ncbi:MAG: hypothetical protein MJZ46_00980 [Bacteroidales bacterium]|nr:hypothetical protein [Bacteroidales bacterium]